MVVLYTLQYKQLLYHDTSKTKCIIYIPDLYNLQTRKKSEMVQTAQIELSTNSNTTRSQI